ncbi:MAG TPA: hypothetical protein VD971_11370 [Phycisphaerales bacterium]|nr:hypothetical protein [Phycisphaerales bacterium]
MPSQPALTCPRCGYDLSGVAATVPLARNESVNGGSDGAACPLDCTCSECGGAFAWSRVLSGAVEWPKWFVESPGGRRGPFATLRTLLRVLRPGKFWREVGFDKPVRAHRLVWWVLVVMAVAPAIALAVPVYARDVVRLFTGTLPVTPATFLYEELQSAAASTTELVDRLLDGGGAVWLLPAFALSAAMAFMLVILPSVRVGIRTRAAFALRAAVYSLAFLPVLFAGSVIARAAAGLDAASAVFDSRPTGWAPTLVPRRSWWVFNDGVEFFWAAVVLGWMGWYWHRAIHEGAHTARPRLIFTVCVVPSVLFALLVMVLHDGALLPFV